MSLNKVFSVGTTLTFLIYRVNNAIKSKSNNAMVKPSSLFTMQKIGEPQRSK